VERAEGNALLAVETARALRAGTGELASNLRGSVRASLAPLDGEGRRLVETAAVAARPLEPREIDQLSLQEAATIALQTGLLISADGRIGFRHALLREAAYEEIAEPRRRAMHQHWARALLASEQAGGGRRPDEVARHLRLAGADTEAVPQLVRAAAAARAVASLEQAVGYLEEALAITPDRAEEWLELGELEAWRGRRDLAERAFERGLVLLERADGLTLARAWLRRARAYHGPICDPRRVLDSARHVLELLDLAAQPAPEERSEAIAARAWAEAVAGSIDEAERLLAELSSMVPEPDDLRTYDAGHARALALIRRGRFAEAYGPSIAAGEAIARAGRPDLAYGCWANAGSAACAAGEPERALEFIARGLEALQGQGLQGLEIHLLGARSFVFRHLGRLEEARAAADSEQVLAQQLAQAGLEAMASHDRGLVALQARDYPLAAELLAAAIVEGAPVSRPLTRLALAEALARAGRPDPAAEQVRATVLEPLTPSDFPDALVPRLARVQGLIALAQANHGEAERRFREAISGWERLRRRTFHAESITTVLTDLGRPVVGLIEPEREVARARADLEAIQKGSPSALVQ
jgi:tetratricopeptide (TPR) repeat protein